MYYFIMSNNDQIILFIIILSAVRCPRLSFDLGLFWLPTCFKTGWGWGGLSMEGALVC